MLTTGMEINQLGRWQLISEKRCGGYMPLNCVTMRLKGFFIIEQYEKVLNNQNPNPRRCNTKSSWAPLGLVGQPTSQGRDLVILSLFDVHDNSLERSLYGLQVKTKFQKNCSEEYCQKNSFRASKWLWKFRTQKTTKKQ